MVGKNRCQQKECRAEADSPLAFHKLCFENKEKNGSSDNKRNGHKMLCQKRPKPIKLGVKLKELFHHTNPARIYFII